MKNDEMHRMVEREQRRQVAQKIIIWEGINEKVLMPMKRDFTRPRIDQLVDAAMRQKQKRGPA